MLKLLCLCSHILLKANCPRCVEAFINCLVSLVQKPLICSFFVCFRFCSIGQKSSKCNTFLGKIDVWVWSKEKNKRDKVWQMKSFSLIAVYPYNHWGNNPQLCLSSPSRVAWFPCLTLSCFCYTFRRISSFSLTYKFEWSCVSRIGG